MFARFTFEPCPTIVTGNTFGGGDLRANYIRPLRNLILSNAFLRARPSLYFQIEFSTWTFVPMKYIKTLRQTETVSMEPGTF